MNKKKEEKEIEENDLVSYVEKKLGHLQPYWSQITLGVCGVIAIMLAGVFLWQKNLEAEAAKWQLLNIAQGNYRRTMDNRSLVEFADQYPDDKAGLWGLLYAADAEMRTGLGDLATDREAGFDKIQKAQKFYQTVVDSKVSKSTMLQRRSVFGLAYASESLGEFEKATELYDQIIAASESDNNAKTKNPFYAEAKRARERTTDQDFAKLYEQFKSFEIAAADDAAPGMDLPKRPDIGFPSDDEQPDSGGGDFSAESTEATTDDNPPTKSDDDSEEAQATTNSSDETEEPAADSDEGK